MLPDCRATSAEGSGGSSRGGGSSGSCHGWGRSWPGQFVSDPVKTQCLPSAARRMPIHVGWMLAACPVRVCSRLERASLSRTQDAERWSSDITSCQPNSYRPSPMPPPPYCSPLAPTRRASRHTFYRTWSWARHTSHRVGARWCWPRSICQPPPLYLPCHWHYSIFLRHNVVFFSYSAKGKEYCGHRRIGCSSSN